MKIERMKRLGRAGALSIASGAIATPAFAYDGEYVTYGGFEATVEAFRYIALFFNHTEYGGLVFTIAAIGFAIGAFNAFTRSQDPGEFAKWAVSFVFGAGLFSAFILPKGNVAVYDPVLNANEIVADVPDGIAILADLSSNFQEVAVSIADAATPRLYADTANGALFDVIRKTWTANNPIADDFVWKSVKSYYLDCVGLATRIPGTGLTADELRNASTDLVASFEKANSPGNYTTLYDAANPGGAPATCAAAWTAISAPVNAVGTYDAFDRAVCANAGFDPTSAPQLTRCREFLDETPALFNGAGDRYSYFRGMALARAMEEAMADANPERAIAAETNRRFIEQAAGFFVTAEEYGPFIRAAFLAAALSTMPLLALFVMTPFMGSVLRLFIGFFAFVTLWSVIDVGIAQVSHGIAAAAFEDVARHNMSYTAFMLSPPASAKALAVFGASRFIAISFAGLFVVTIFKISGASFASITGPIQGTASAAGDGAANAILNPMGRMSAASQLASAAGTGAALGTAPGSFTSFEKFNQSRLAQTDGLVMGAETMIGAGRYASMQRGLGAMEGGRQTGQFAAGVAAAGASPAGALAGDGSALNMIAGTQQRAARADTMQGLSRTLNMQQMAESFAAIGKGTADDYLRRMSTMGDIQQSAQLRAAGYEPQTMGAVAGIEAGSRMGGAFGLDAATRALGTTPQRQAELSAQNDAYWRFGENQALQRFGAGAVSNAGETHRAQSIGVGSGYGSAGNAYEAGYWSGTQSSASSANALMMAEKFGMSPQEFATLSNGRFGVVVGKDNVDRFAPYLSSEAAAQGRETGLYLELGVDGRNGAIVTQSATAMDKLSVDQTTSYASGISASAAPRVDGDTIATWAHSGGKGAMEFSKVIDQAERSGAGAAFEAIAVRNVADYLGRTYARQEVTDTESGVSQVGVQASIAGNWKIPFVKGVEAGFGGKASSDDINSIQRAEMTNAFMPKVQELWDRTIDNRTSGTDSFDRAAAFAVGYKQLEIEARAMRDDLASKGADPDGVMGQFISPNRRGQGEENERLPSTIF